MPTVEHVLRQAERELKASDLVEHPHRGKELADAEELLLHAMGRVELDADEDVDPETLRTFQRLVARRLTGEPPAYITGWTEFHGLRLAVGRGAFIPRQSSEWMADQAIRRLRPRREPVHVDMATGVGPVALAVAKALSRAQVYGADISAKALAHARRNAAALGLGNATFLKGDLFDALPDRLRGQVDVVTVHPPYVGRRELKDLPHEILGFEPRESLTDESPLGDRILSVVAGESPSWLRHGGWLLVEVSPDRAREVATTLRRSGLSDVRSTKGGISVSRVVVGRRA
jgi:release factor glutamine methyltransferase